MSIWHQWFLGFSVDCQIISLDHTCRHVFLAGDDHPPGGDVLALGRSSCHGGGGHVWKKGDRENIGDVLQAPSELRLLRTTFHSCCAIASELLRIHVFLYLRTFLLPRRKRSAGGQTWWLRPARNTWVDMSYLNWYLHHTELLLLFFCLCRFSYFLTLSIFKRFLLFSCWHVEFKMTWVRAPMFQIRNSSTRSLLSHKCPDTFELQWPWQRQEEEEGWSSGTARLCLHRLALCKIFDISNSWEPEFMTMFSIWYK